MSKKPLNGWTKWVIFGVGIILVIVVWIWQASGIARDVEITIRRVDKAEAKVDANAGDIRELKTDVKYIREGIDRIEKRLPGK